MSLSNAKSASMFSGDEIHLQVDDKHQLYDNDGELTSEGSTWSTVYTAKGVGPFVIYAENGVSYVYCHNHKLQALTSLSTLK